MIRACLFHSIVGTGLLHHTSTTHMYHQCIINTYTCNPPAAMVPPPAVDTKPAAAVAFPVPSTWNTDVGVPAASTNMSVEKRKKESKREQKGAKGSKRERSKQSEPEGYEDIRRCLCSGPFRTCPWGEDLLTDQFKRRVGGTGAFDLWGSETEGDEYIRLYIRLR